MKRATTLWIIVAIVIVAGLWYWSQRPAGETDQVGQEQGKAETTQPKDEGAFEDVAIEVAELAAVSPYTGSGEATRQFDGSVFSHTVTANLGAPAAGKFYEGWLVMPTEAGPQFFSTGELTQQDEGYALSFTANQDYPDHTRVVITEETSANGFDNQPEDHVLEGDF